MNRKMFKRLGTFTLAVLMMFSISATAFATNVLSEERPISKESGSFDDGLTVEGVASTYGVGDDYTITVQPRGKATLTIPLPSSIGFKMKFNIASVTSDFESVAVVTLVDPSGKVMFANYWLEGNDSDVWTFSLPKSGNYKLGITIADGSAPVKLHCWWTYPS